MITTLRHLSPFHYSVFRLTIIAILYLAYLALVYSMIVSYVHPELRLINFGALIVLASSTWIFSRYCPKR